MFTYKDVLKDKQIIENYIKIEDKTNYVISHGLIHVKNVLKICKNIAKEMELSKQKKRLLCISAVLHDIGRIEENKKHNFASEEFAKNYLKDKLNACELEVVCNAIKYHSQEYAEFDVMDDVAYCLLLADKLDYQKSRLLKKLMCQATTPHFNKLKYCDKMIVKKQNNELIVNVYQNNSEMQQIVKDMDRKVLHEILKNFILHFKLKDYTFKFI